MKAKSGVLESSWARLSIGKSSQPTWQPEYFHFTRISKFDQNTTTWQPLESSLEALSISANLTQQRINTTFCSLKRGLLFVVAVATSSSLRALSHHWDRHLSLLSHQKNTKSRKWRRYQEEARVHYYTRSIWLRRSEDTIVASSAKWWSHLRLSRSLFFDKINTKLISLNIST
jgi:hypothetical protein